MKNLAVQVLKLPQFWIYIASLTLITANLFLTQHSRPYTSDDVTWQTILFHWRPFSGEKITLGSTDNFVDKLPFFAFMEHFFSPSRKLLFAEATILALGGFTFFYFSALYFLKRIGTRLSFLNLLPFVWLASFGYSFAELYLNPIWRGFEVGFSFFTFMIIAKYLNGEITLRKRIAILWSVIFLIAQGALIYSDPYYLYFTIGAAALFCISLLYLKKITTQQFGIAIGGIAIAYLVSKIVAVLSALAGISMAAVFPTQFVNFEQLGHNLGTAIHSLLIIYGADFFGKDTTDLMTVVGIMNMILLVFIVGAACYLVTTANQNKFKKVAAQHLWMVFFSILPLSVFAVYTLSTLVDLTTYRYFFILVFSSILVAVCGMGMMQNKNRLIIGGIFTISIILNSLTAIHGTGAVLQPGEAGNRRNSLNYALISAVEAENLTKGYANYWQGAINTYLSGDKVSFLPSLCLNGQTTKLYWLVNNDDFSLSAQRSFYLVDPDIPQPGTCNVGQLIAQFGAPEKIINIGDKSILVYGYDITHKMLQQ